MIEDVIIMCHNYTLRITAVEKYTCICDYVNYLHNNVFAHSTVTNDDDR